MRQLFLYILLFSLVACHDSGRYPAELVQADSAYMRGDYPLADSLMEAYDSLHEHDVNTAVGMYLQLLKMEQLFMQSDINESHFSITDSLCRYYANNDAYEEYGKALLFQGAAYYSVGDNPSALEYYLKAEKVVRQIGNMTLLGIIYKLQGEVYCDQRMYEDGAVCHRKSLEIAKACQDTVRIVHAAMHMGIVYTAEDKVDSTLNTYFYVLDLMRKYPHRNFSVPVVNWRISNIYIQIGEYEKALAYMSHEPFYWNNWGYWHYGQHHVDSAIYYFERILNRSSLYGQEEKLRLLVQLEKEKKNLVKAMEYADRLIAVEDSIKEISQVDETRKVEARHTLNIVKHERDELEVRQRELERIFYMTIICVVSLSLIVYYAWRNYKYRKGMELLQERRLRQIEADKLKQSSEQIERNKKEIAALQSQLEEARKMNDAETVNKLEYEAEKLEAENNNIEANRRHREFKEKHLRATPLYQHIMKHAGQDDFHLTGDQWQELALLIDDAYDHFTDRLLGLSRLSENELRVCYLIKLGVASAHIATMMFKSKSAVTMMRQRMCRKILKKEGTATQLNEFICSL